MAIKHAMSFSFLGVFVSVLAFTGLCLVAAVELCSKDSCEYLFLAQFANNTFAVSCQKTKSAQ